MMTKGAEIRTKKTICDDKNADGSCDETNRLLSDRRLYPKDLFVCDLLDQKHKINID
jgi:hypothetical protein